MKPEFIAAAREEEAVLERKLVAVRALLAAYAEEGDAAPAPNSKVVTVLAERAREKPKYKAWSDRPKDQFTPYGQSVVDAAVGLIRSTEKLPIKTREVTERLQARGVEIRGNDPVNALGALLARCSHLESMGKRGWTLAKPYGVLTPNENEAPTGDADGASDAGEEGAPPPTNPFHSNPFLTGSTS